MYKEATIHVPVLYNTGKTIEQSKHAQFEEEILNNLSNGFSISQVSGVWRNDKGKIYREEMNRYTIAVKYDTIEKQYESHRRLKELARFAKKQYDQEAIYIINPNGQVEFI